MRNSGLVARATGSLVGGTSQRTHGRARGPATGDHDGQGLIRRRAHAYGQHAHEIELTPEGRRLLAKADRLALAVEAQLVVGLSAAEIADLVVLLRRCVANLAPTAAGATAPPRGRRAGQTRAGRP